MTNTAVSARSGRKAFRPIFLVFILINAGGFSARQLLDKWGINADVALTGNLILFLATAISYYFYFRSFQNDRPQVFMKFVYAGMVVKMLICLFAAVLYIMIAGKQVNKGGVILSMAFYVVYSALEIVILLRLSRQIKQQRNG